MNKIVILSGAAVAMLFAPLAFAQSGNDAYLSLSVGPSRASVDCTDTTTCDRSSVATKVLLGYRVLPQLAVEASYAYLGKVKATVADSEDVASASITGQSLGIGVAGLFPFGGAKEWTAILRGGVASNRARVSASFGSDSASDSESHVEPYFGLGLNYALTPSFEAGIAWDTTKTKYADTSTRVNVFSLVGTLRF